MVKVADFGLTRDMYISDYYVMSHSNPLPVKWLAPEVLFDKIFSEKTDVVSFSDNSNSSFTPYNKMASFALFVIYCIYICS